jgi:hypothetical protein
MRHLPLLLLLLLQRRLLRGANRTHIGWPPAGGRTAGHASALLQPLLHEEPGANAAAARGADARAVAAAIAGGPQQGRAARRQR